MDSKCDTVVDSIPFWFHMKRQNSSNLLFNENGNLTEELFSATQEVDISEHILRNYETLKCIHTDQDTASTESDEEKNIELKKTEFSDKYGPEPNKLTDEAWKVDCADVVTLDGSDYSDIPSRYTVPVLKSYEYNVVGVCIDRRITPGFKYKVKPIDYLGSNENDEYLFDGKSVRLQSIGRGYCRRVTFAPLAIGSLNNNDNYFWTDSRPHGFAFQLEVVSVDEKYTLYSTHCHPIGHLKIIKLQCPQEEISHVVLDDKSVEKKVKVCFLAEVEWYYENEDTVTSVSGIAICNKPYNGIAKINRIVDAVIGLNSNEMYTLIPGIDNRKRCIFVSGALCQDIPFEFTITGLEIYELPVIGTYVDPRIIPGFYYRVRPAISDIHLFNGSALLLQNIGMGYSKRITFHSSKNQRNRNDNYFWTDSWPGGFGFEIRAIHEDTCFDVYAKNQLIGNGSVFRVDEPQREEKQLVIKGNKGTSLVKYVHVDLTCHVTFNMASGKMEELGEGLYDDHIMRISGVAVLAKHPNRSEAVLVRVEDIGLDSQLNLLFLNQHSDVVLYPTKIPVRP